MSDHKSKIQMVWGIALLIAGIGVFYRIPQIMPKIETIQQFASASFFVRFCLYLIGGILIGGGIKKIYNNFKR